MPRKRIRRRRPAAPPARPVPEAPEDKGPEPRERRPRQAIVVIHGIGEQRPLGTIRGFVAALTDGVFRSKPDRLSESFELRRLVLSETKTLPPTDVYELYWAHHMQAAQWSAAARWMSRLILRRPSKVPAGLRSLHAAMCVVILGVLGALVWSALDAVGEGGGGLSDFATSATTYVPVAAVVAQWLTGRFVLGYMGDAARYLTPDPENIEARTAIRAEGVSLLRRLHESKLYFRVVVVGHSLGSVIGYDVLRHLWDEYRMPDFAAPRPQPEAAKFEQAIEAVTQPAPDVSRAEAVDRFQQAQHRLWREHRGVGTPWLVTDFVTLGSPLAHAELLLEDPHISLERRKQERELPTCPPTSGDEPAHYGENRVTFEDGRRRKWHYRIPNHGAVFSGTRWTNLYFPHSRLLLGDVIGGPLAGVFGVGIRDVAVRPSHAGWLARTLASHVYYWQRDADTPAEPKAARKERDKLTGTKDAVTALRSALLLEAWRSKDPWPRP